MQELSCVPLYFDGIFIKKFCKELLILKEVNSLHFSQKNALFKNNYLDPTFEL